MKALEFIENIKAYFGMFIHESAIVGGAARDVYYGRPYADIDFGIIPVGLIASDADTFMLMKQISRHASRLGIRSEVMRAYGISANGEDVQKCNNFSRRLFGCIKVHCEDYVVDVLLSKSMSILEMVKGFDTNFNMFVANPELTAADYVGYADMAHPTVELVLFARGYEGNPERKPYMIAKHKEYTGRE